MDSSPALRQSTNNNNNNSSTVEHQQRQQQQQQDSNSIHGLGADGLVHRHTCSTGTHCSNIPSSVATPPVSAAAAAAAASDGVVTCPRHDGVGKASTVRRRGSDGGAVRSEVDRPSACSTMSTNSGGKFSKYMNGRAKANQAYVPTDIEHLANVVTHGLWIAPSIAGLWWMTSMSNGFVQHVSALIYGLSLFFLFTVSTTFHALAYCGRFKDLHYVFHIGDRAVIYIFIASSYTPWLALKDFNRCGLLMLFVVWVAAVLGIYYQYTFHERYKWLETLLYLVIGMAPAIIVFEMKEASGLFELMLGGLVYVVGVVFFKCDGVIPFAHAIWHSFVFVGAMFHFVAVCRYLLGPAAPEVVAAAAAAAAGAVDFG